MPNKYGGLHREVLSHLVVQSPRGALFVRRNLDCGHVSDKRFSPADHAEYGRSGHPFRIPRYAFCKECRYEGKIV